jgi:hypothetical protein
MLGQRCRQQQRWQRQQQLEHPCSCAIGSALLDLSCHAMSSLYCISCFIPFTANSVAITQTWWGIQHLGYRCLCFCWLLVERRGTAPGTVTILAIHPNKTTGTLILCHRSQDGCQAHNVVHSVTEVRTLVSHSWQTQAMLSLKHLSLLFAASCELKADVSD